MPYVIISILIDIKERKRNFSNWPGASCGVPPSLLGEGGQGDEVQASGIGGGNHF